MIAVGEGDGLARRSGSEKRDGCGDAEQQSQREGKSFDGRSVHRAQQDYSNSGDGRVVFMYFYDIAGQDFLDEFSEFARGLAASEPGAPSCGPR